MEMIRLQIQILVFLVIGWVFGKKQWITRDAASQLNFLVMNLILPCSIFSAFLSPPDSETLQASASILVLAILLQGVFWLVSRFLWKSIKDPAERTNLEYGTVSNNAGTLGMVIGQAAFGTSGMLYTSIYSIPLRIVMWSYGVTLYNRQSGVSDKALLKKVVTHPCMIAIFLGLIFMLGQPYGLLLPDLMRSTIAALGSCNTVLIMIVIGVILSDLPLKDLFGKTIVAYTLIRLILIPAAVLAGLALFQIGGMPLKICVLESAMPAPVTMAMLSQKYHCKESFSSRMIFLSTALSMLTLPVWTLVLQTFF